MFWHCRESSAVSRLDAFVDPFDKSRGAREPKANAEYWRRKIAANRQRDERNREALASAGWVVLTVWECALGDRTAMETRLKDFLSDAPSVAARE